MIGKKKKNLFLSTWEIEFGGKIIIGLENIYLKKEERF